MGIATRKQGDGTKSGSWHVRNEKGETFGPVDLESLRAWACDGRLAPTNEVSENGCQWRLATSVRSLEMDWVAEVAPGTFYGPIHRRAMEELVKDGSIAAQCFFFVRRGLDERSDKQTDIEQTEKLRRLYELAEQRAASSEEQARQAQSQVTAYSAQLEQTRQQVAGEQQMRQQLAAQAEQAQRQAAASVEQVRQAQSQVTAYSAQLEQVRQQSACEQQMRQQITAQAEQAQRQVAAYEEQLRLAQQQVTACTAQAEQARQQTAVVETHLQVTVQQMAAQTEQAGRQVAAYEGQLRLAQQQVAAYASQLEQARQQSSAAEERLRMTALQMSEQAEQASAAQRQGLAKAEELAGEVSRLRKENAESVAKAAELRAERDARAVALESQAHAFAAERQELHAALSHAQAETAVRAAQLTQLEKALKGTEGVGAECGVLDSQVRALGAELVGMQQALACEKDAALQAEARCAALEAALQEARAHRVREASLEDVNAELKRVRQQVEELCAQFRQANDASERERAQRASERVTVVEAVEVEVLPPERPKPSANAQEAERAAPGGHGRKPAEAPPASNPGRAAPGLSLADLEQQARRELERLGAQGANLFKKKR